MNGDNYLVTTTEWFYAPDGRKYRSVWGYVEILDDSILGIKTNRNSVNWYAKIGDENHHIIVAGCQINYAVRCENKPVTTKIKEIQYNGSSSCEITRENEIYIAQDNAKEE